MATGTSRVRPHMAAAPQVIRAITKAKPPRDINAYHTPMPVAPPDSLLSVAPDGITQDASSAPPPPSLPDLLQAIISAGGGGGQQAPQVQGLNIGPSPGNVPVPALAQSQDASPADSYNYPSLPALNTAYPQPPAPPLLPPPPQADDGANQAGQRRAMQLSSILPLLGILTGSADYAGKITPTIVHGAFTGEKARQDAFDAGNLQDWQLKNQTAQSNFGLQQSAYQDKVRQMDATNTAANNLFQDSLDLSKQKTDDARARTLQQKADDAKKEADVKAKIAEDRARTSFLSKFQTALSGQDPAWQQAYMEANADIAAEHGIEFARDENGNIIPMRLEKYQEMDKNRAQKMTIAKMTESGKNARSAAGIKSREGIATRHDTAAMARIQATLGGREYLATLSNSIRSEANDIARARVAVSADKADDPTKAIKLSQYLDTRIGSYQEKIQAVKNRLKPKLIRGPGGVLNFIGPTQDEIDRANEEIASWQDLIDHAKEAQQSAMPRAGLTTDQQRNANQYGYSGTPQPPVPTPQGSRMGNIPPPPGFRLGPAPIVGGNLAPAAVKPSGRPGPINTGVSVNIGRFKVKRLK